MERLKTSRNNLDIYNAGLPGFPRNFSRDSFISGIIVKDSQLLKNQLILSAERQGKTKNSFMGEEKGKIFHELPGVIINKCSTEYNACDTTALFLIAHYYYKKISGDESLSEKQKENIINAVEYIKSHLKDYLFFEDPLLCGSDNFALKVTYWKDSEIVGRKNGIPSYPISYYLAHVINLCGLRYAAILLNSEEIKMIADKMKEKIHTFFNLKDESLIIAIDSEGKIEGISSDMLHSLFYLEPGDLNDEEIELIQKSSKELETSAGYLTLSPKFSSKVNDIYHSNTVWPFEQAIINMGTKKFGLENIETISRRVINYLDTEPENFIISGDQIKKSGCDPQLWTIAAKKYFSDQI